MGKTARALNVISTIVSVMSVLIIAAIALGACGPTPVSAYYGSPTATAIPAVETIRQYSWTNIEGPGGCNAYAMFHYTNADRRKTYDDCFLVVCAQGVGFNCK